MTHITLVAGARPNFMKIAPIIRAVKQAKGQGQNINYSLVHTGQHFDRNMSGRFFEELNIPAPDVNLGAGGGSHAMQTAAIMVGFEKYLQTHLTDLVLVVGDVNSTMACAIVAKKMNLPVAHVEGGLRSGDRTMPEEINRIVTDSITDYFFTTSKKANENLLQEGADPDHIFLVGNTMIDTLLSNLSRLRKPLIWDTAGLSEKEFLLLTMHRPANVDQIQKLESYLRKILAHSRGMPIVFPVHPRTRERLQSVSIESPNLFITEPLGYLEFIYLLKHAKAVITDSGGVTEEASVLEVPCMTLRDSTERPETIELGTNELLGTEPSYIPPALEKLFAGIWKQGGELPFWDGRSAERIVDHLIHLLQICA